MVFLFWILVGFKKIEAMHTQALGKVREAATCLQYIEEAAGPGHQVDDLEMWISSPKLTCLLKIDGWKM